jgi:hypothetical protein
MNASHIDRLSRSLATRTGRRGAVQRLALAAVGIGGVAMGSEPAMARHRKHRVKRNAFGCVNVGNYCRTDDQCCSHRCQDHTCRAHDTGRCKTGQRDQNCGGKDVACVGGLGNRGVCETTTGKAPYCASSVYCVECATDKDCQSYCGPRAACVLCSYYCPGPSCVGPDVCSGPGEE